MSRDMQLKVMMEKMNKLANAAHNAPDKGMKQIWTDKWYALVKQYSDSCLLYTSPSPRDRQKSRMPSSA